MNLLKKAMSAFVEIEDTPAKPAPAASQTGPTPSRPAASFTAGTAMPTARQQLGAMSQEDIQKFEEHFDQLLKNANLPGPDYHEFNQVLDTLEAHIPDERARMSAAFATLAIQGLTKDKLISSAQTYIDVIEKDRTGFEGALKAKMAAEVDGRKKQIDDLQKQIAENSRQIQLLTKDISDCQEKIKALTGDIGESEARIRANEGAYLAACDAMIGKIKSDIEKAQTIA
jgi:predicted  nucleic acid-binding Zn-ribbon protein